MTQQQAFNILIFAEAQRRSLVLWPSQCAYRWSLRRSRLTAMLGMLVASH